MRPAMRPPAVRSLLRISVQTRTWVPGGAGVGGVSVGQDRLQDQGAAAVAMGRAPGRQEVHAADNLLDTAVADAGQVLAHLFGHEGEVVYDVFDLALEPAVDQVLALGGDAGGAGVEGALGG